jgi:hypothetical protein
LFWSIVPFKDCNFEKLLGCFFVSVFLERGISEKIQRKFQTEKSSLGKVVQCTTEHIMKLQEIKIQKGRLCLLSTFLNL